MTILVDALRQLLETGTLVFREPPRFPADQLLAGRAFLREAYERYRLDVAGPPLAFQEDLALRAALLVLDSGWFLCSRPSRPRSWNGA